MVTSHENMEMKMGDLGIASSLTSRAFDVRRESSDLHAHAVQGNGGATKRTKLMNKLMIAAAATLCAAVGYSDVSSANIVGYQNADFIGNGKFNFTCNTFKGVGKELTKMTLGDIKPNENWGGGADKLQTLTKDGGIDKTYTYMNATDAKDWGFTEGWYLFDEYNDDTLDLTDRCHNGDVIPFGQSFIVNVGSTATKLVYAGEVHGEDQPLTLIGNGKFNFVGNASPINLTLGDIRPNENWGGGADKLQTLTQDGGIDKTYTYMNATDAKDWGFTEGWYLFDEYNDDTLDLTDRCQNSTPIPASKGFTVNVGSAATSVIIPTAL